MAKQSEVLNRKREAYLAHKGGMSISQIAEQMNLSERMIYRYIDEFELVQLRNWRSLLDEALSVLPDTATIADLNKVIAAKQKKQNGQ